MVIEIPWYILAIQLLAIKFLLCIFIYSIVIFIQTVILRIVYDDDWTNHKSGSSLEYITKTTKFYHFDETSRIVSITDFESAGLSFRQANIR